jgi:hypothetical protein
MKASEYQDLIQKFLDGSFAEAEEFARTYDKVFLSEPNGMSEELFKILGDFWVDIEAYSPLWELKDIDEVHITEETLREEAIDAVEKLGKYLKAHPEKNL